MNTVDTDRTEVRVTLPAYQKERWAADAEELGMSQAEFVRTMVQAGRRDLSLEEDRQSSGADPAEGDPDTVDPGGNAFESAVLEILREEGAMSWDELVAEVLGDVEDELETTMDDLQDDGRIKHSGRKGGYVLTDE